MKHKIFIFTLLFLAIYSYQLHAESDTLWTTAIGSTVRTVKFSPDGDYVYAAAIDRGIIKLNAQNGDILQEFEGFKYSDYSFNNAVDVSPDGKMIVGGDFHKLYLYNNEDGKIIDSLESNTSNYPYNRFNEVLFTKDNKYVIGCVNYGNSTTNPPSRLFIWDLATKKIIYYLNGDRIVKLAIDKQNKTLAYIEKNQGDDDYNINLLEIGTWKNVGVLKGHTSRITDLSFSPDGSLLGSCDDEAFVKIWDIESNEIGVAFKFEGVQMDAINIFQIDKIVLGGGSFDDWKFISKNITQNKEYYSMDLRVKDIDFKESIGFIIAENRNILLIQKNKLLGINLSLNDDLLYPNPANNLLTVPKTFFGDSFVAMSITDLTGKVGYTFDNNQQIEDLIIDVSAYNTGTYYLNFNYKSRSQSSRFIRE